MPPIPKSSGKSKISTIPTLPRISEHTNSAAAVMVVVPPDGGFAWCIVAASFLINFLIDGILFSFGVFLQPLTDALHVSHTQVTLIGSLQMGMYYMFGPFTCAAVNRYGFRRVGVTGACLAAMASLTASFTSGYWPVLFCYGLGVGLGTGICSTPAVIIVGYYFERYRAIATGVALCGCSAGILCLSPLFGACIERYGWQRTVQVQAALLAVCAALCLTFRQIAPTRLVLLEEEPAAMPLDECADAISDTSSQIEFKMMPGWMRALDSVPHIPLTAQVSAMSRRTAAVSMKTFRSRYVALYQEPNKPRGNRLQRLREYMGHILPCWQPQATVVPNASASADTMTTWKTGPLNRQDIFYSGSLVHIPEYRNEYQTAAETRPQRVDSNITMPMMKCGICPRTLTDVLGMLIDVSLLRSYTFAVILVMNFLYVLGLFTPYMFLSSRATENGISAELGMWLVSILSLGNMTGRIMAGCVSFVPALNVVNLVAGSTIAAGMLTIIGAFFGVSMWSVQILYASMLGFTLAFNPPLRTIIYVQYLGLERLTNAFGLSTVITGLAAMVGAPAAGFVYVSTGQYRYAFLLAGLCHLFSGLVLLALRPVHRWEMRRRGGNVHATVSTTMRRRC